MGGLQKWAISLDDTRLESVEVLSCESRQPLHLIWALIMRRITLSTSSTTSADYSKTRYPGPDRLQYRTRPHGNEPVARISRRARRPRVDRHDSSRHRARMHLSRHC